MIIAKFTPSLIPRPTLERIFVAREPILDAIMDRIRAAATTASQNHTLLIGPRGAGKTHLIALAYYRTLDLIEFGHRLQVSWLPEDPWKVVSYRHLLAAVLDGLTPAPSGRDPIPTSEQQLESMLVDLAHQHGPIVVLVENLDQILARLTDLGQQRLRHLLQSEEGLLLVATTTRLERDLSDQARPFYGFFTTTRLQPFSVTEAQQMLRALAVESGDHDLVDQLNSETTMARLRAIQHLAGGQPRMWTALASALTIDQLDKLVELFLTRFDDLTPYYQEQMGRLSPQQLQLVAELAEADHPVHVSELAERIGVDQRSLGKTVTELVDRGWITAVNTPVGYLLDRRRTYYELAEPLARISFQIKESRGRPLQLIVDFIKGWFDPKDLAAAHGDPANEYLELAVFDYEHDAVTRVVRQLRRLPESRAPALELLGTIDDALADLANRRADRFLRLPIAVRTALEERLGTPDSLIPDSISLRAEIHTAALNEVGNVPHPALPSWRIRAEDLVNQSHQPAALLVLAHWLASSWTFDEAEAVLKAAKQEVIPNSPTIQTAQSHLAAAYQSAGRLAPAIRLYEQALADRERILSPDHPDTLTSRNNLASAYQAAGRVDQAIPIYEQNLTDMQRVLGPHHPNTLTSRNNLASAYQAAGRVDQAIPIYEQNLTDRARILGPDHPETLTSRNNLAYASTQTNKLK